MELVPEQDTGPKKIQLVEVQHVQEILLSKKHVIMVPAVHTVDSPPAPQTKKSNKIRPSYINVLQKLAS